MADADAEPPAPENQTGLTDLPWLNFLELLNEVEALVDGILERLTIRIQELDERELEITKHEKQIAEQLADLRKENETLTATLKLLESEDESEVEDLQFKAPEEAAVPEHISSTLVRNSGKVVEEEVNKMKGRNTAEVTAPWAGRLRSRKRRSST